MSGFLVSRSAPPPPHHPTSLTADPCIHVKRRSNICFNLIIVPYRQKCIYHKYLDVLTEQFSFIVSICFNVKFLFNFEIQEIDRNYTEVLTCTEASEKVTCMPYNARKDHVSIWRVFLLCASIYFSWLLRWLFWVLFYNSSLYILNKWFKMQYLSKATED